MHSCNNAGKQFDWKLQGLRQEKIQLNTGSYKKMCFPPEDNSIYTIQIIKSFSNSGDEFMLSSPKDSLQSKK